MNIVINTIEKQASIKNTGSFTKVGRTLVFELRDLYLLDMHYKTQVTNTAIFEVIFQRGLQFLT
jgi:hypothetical protein